MENANGNQSARPRLSQGIENLQVHQDTESLPPPSSSNHTHKQLLKDLEVQLLASLTRAVNDAIQTLKQHVETELQSFRDEVESLTTRVLKLDEDATQKYNVGPTSKISDSYVGGGEEAVKMMYP